MSFQSKELPSNGLRFQPYFIYIAPCIALLLYAASFKFGFVLDDEAVIEKNRFVQMGFAGIPKLLTTWYWQGYWNQNAGLYRPLSMISFAIEWAVSPNNPLLHHVVQVILYAISLVQVYKLVSRLSPNDSLWPAVLVALLFAVHPMHTEVVANIKSRDELLCFLFFTIAANELLKHRKVTVISGLCFLAALLSKESGLLYLPVFFLILYQFCGKSFREALKEIVPLVVIGALWLGWHAYIINSSLNHRVAYTYEDNSILACTGFASRVFTGLEILGRYIIKCFYPYQMSYDYSFSELPCAGNCSIAGSIVLLAAVGLIYWAIRHLKDRPIISFGILFFFCTILLVTNIFTLIGTTMGDRLLYAPLLGMIIAFVYGVKQLTTNKIPDTITVGSFMIIVLLFISMSSKRAMAWRSNLDLFRTDAAVAPNSSRTQYNYAAALLTQLPVDSNEKHAALEEVVSRSIAAAAIDSSRGGTYVNLGVAQYKLKRYPDAIKSFRTALRLNNKDSVVYLNLADAYLTAGKVDSACSIYEWCLQHRIEQPNTYTFYGKALFSLGKFDQAVAAYKTGLEKHPSDAELWLNYGSSLAMTKSFDAALKAFNRAYQLNPGEKRALYYLSITYEQLGNKQLADYYLKQWKQPG